MTTALLRAPLAIQGGPLEEIIARFRDELGRAGVRLQPHFYLSDEWGVLYADDDDQPFDPPVRSIAIPFYLASAELTRLHARHYEVAGTCPDDVLRYLRHELGHVVNYTYRLYKEEGWTELFGAFERPYPDGDYEYDPLSRDFVQNLPWSYAQKHPDEDWAETFAVWMTPWLDWRSKYRGWPRALAKLEYCDRTMKALRDPPQEPRPVAESEAYTRVPDGWYPSVSSLPARLRALPALAWAVAGVALGLGVLAGACGGLLLPR
jgi:hypothetical protein